MRKDSKLVPYLPYPRFLLDVNLTQLVDFIARSGDICFFESWMLLEERNIRP